MVKENDYEYVLSKVFKRFKHMGHTDHKEIIYFQEKEINYYRNKIFKLEKDLRGKEMEKHKLDNIIQNYHAEDKTSTWISVYTNKERLDITVNVPIEEIKKRLSDILGNEDKFFSATDYMGNVYFISTDVIEHIELYQVKKRES